MYYVNALITAKTFVLYCKRLSVSLFSVCKDKKLLKNISKINLI